MTKEHAMLLSVFLLFKFLSKDLIIAALTVYFIRGIAALSAALTPSIKRFLTKECNYEEVVSQTPLMDRQRREGFIHTLVDSIKSWVVASIPGFLFFLWCAAKKYCLANNVFGISSHIQGIEMLSLGSFKTGAILLLMVKLWCWNNMYGIKLKKFDGLVLHTTNEDGDGGDDATALPEDHRGGLEDGNSGMDDIAAPFEDPDGQDNRGAASEDSEHVIFFCPRVVQVLAIRANFPIITINGYDGQQGRCIYTQHEGEVQEKGMVDLVLIGPSDVLMADSPFILEVFYYTNTAGDEGSIEEGWDVCENKVPEEYTETICPGPGRELEITFLVIPHAIEAHVNVRLKLKDLGSISCAVYGKIKASATGYGNKSVHLFSCERARSQFFPSGCSSILPLSPSVIALSYCLQPEVHIEVDLTIITCESQGSQEEDKNLKFTLKFTRQIRSQERELDDDQVEVNIIWDFKEMRISKK
ncbi:hypothetical protein EJB05_46059 [Eragrostis curvula]|uniref:DUF6598 domain-containing protein n=1 Tax=Eragrostis curvula TaxID=38414 RepID=A0A5J9TM91_9POAL|nr:hypothetical protein EJB05_46059 [Eragrostis curvula]